MELTNAYATLGAQGRRGKPVLVKRVFSRQGERLEENGPVMTQAIRPEVAFVTADMLRAVVEDPDGTAHGLAAPLGRPVAGKTGTASESRDAWFVGMTPDLAAGVWVGFDDHEPLGQKETGGRAAGPIWLDFMKAAVEVRAREEFVAPPGVVKVRIDPRTGERASDDSPYYEDDYFVAGTEPAETARSGASTEQFFLGGPGGP
jgi:penicillin-binding protein 1A